VSAEENKALVRQWLDEVWNNGQVDRVPHYYAPNYTIDGEPKSLERIANEIQAARTSFPDAQLTIDDMVAEANTVAYRYTWRVTHKQDSTDPIFGEIPATGKAITMRAMTFVRLENGKIVEDWASMDLLGLYQQLGVIPMSKQSEQVSG
jgi:steroid delta-isomerase-like uncharacterized protein